MKLSRTQEIEILKEHLLFLIEKERKSKDSKNSNISGLMEIWKQYDVEYRLEMKKEPLNVSIEQGDMVVYLVNNKDKDVDLQKTIKDQVDYAIKGLVDGFKNMQRNVEM